MKLIVGLGNPGDSYKNTRHNLGFAVLDELADKFGVRGSWSVEKKFKSEILKINNDLWLIKPQTFMNDSGIAVSLLATYYKLPTIDIIVIHDDVDIVLGKIKVRMGGSGGGHHGVESVIKSLGDDKFTRVRLGIGEGKKDVEKFVLETFLPSERSKVKHMIKTAVEAVDLILEQGLKEAQNQFN
ncbi:MAG: aminoacyl-tRNA hydrolase [Candidatus Daviesbacteria bacterium]|nr:aminoacyl-tRNA hydrolase [Candidatus Daviesbacteria bacterium]